MTDAGTQGGLNSGQKKIALMFAIAFVPIFVAYGLYFFFPSLMPSGTTNRGVLVTPPVTTEMQRTHWTLFVAVNPDCDEACRDVLYETRQIHVALGKEAGRLERHIVTSATPAPGFRQYLDTEQPNAVLVVDPVLHGRLRAIHDAANVVYVMDPLGNIMMYYPAEIGGKPMLQDLKHLLKVSGIG